MNLDDKSLFLDAMEDVQPLKRNNDVHWHPGRNSRAPQRVDTLQLDNFLTTGYLDIVPLATPLEFKREGLQSGVLDKLRRGNTASRRASPCCASRWNSAGRCSSPLWCRRRRGVTQCADRSRQRPRRPVPRQYYPQLSGALAGRAAGGAGLLRRASASWRQRRLLCRAA